MQEPQELTELKRRVEADDPDALLQYADLLRDIDPEEAYKFTVLSAQLGNPAAIERMGDDYLTKGDTETAAQYYKRGAKAGVLDCSVKLAMINLENNEHAALFELEELAQMGVKSACVALADYYKRSGNKKESAYWRSMLK